MHDAINHRRCPMTVRLARWLLILACTVALTGCDKINEFIGNKDATKTATADKKADKKGKDAPAIPVVTASVVEQTVPVKIQAIGNVEVQTSVAIKSRVDGQIMRVGFSDGQDVAKGQVLFEIDARPSKALHEQALASLQRDKATLERARQQEDRYKDLLQKGFVSQDAYAQYRTNVDTAAAAVRATEATVETARLQMEYAVIRSPIDGRAGKILIPLGNLVKANDTPSLAVINQLSPIYVSFAVPEQHLQLIRKYMGQGKLVVDAVPSSAAGTPEAATTGTLAFVDNTVDTATGTVRLRAVFPNTEKLLWPGQFVTTTVTLNEQQNALVVPSQAVQTGPKGQFVYVVASGVAQMRDVAVERIDGPRTIIAKGVAAGEQIVIQGQSRLVPGIKVNARPEGKGTDKAR